MSKKKIVVIDDSSTIRELVGMILENAGYTVYTGASGQDSIQLFDGREIDLVIADLYMPGMDGISVAQEVRKMNGYSKVPFILLATALQTSTQEEAKKSGVTGWVMKPFAANKLLAVVSKVLR